MLNMNNKEVTFNSYADLEDLLINVNSTLSSLPARIENMLASTVLNGGSIHRHYFKSCHTLFKTESLFHAGCHQLLILPRVAGIDITIYYSLDSLKSQYSLSKAVLTPTNPDGSKTNITKSFIPLCEMLSNLEGYKLGVPEIINIHNFMYSGLPLIKESEKDYPSMLAIEGTLTLNYVEYLEYKYNGGDYNLDAILSDWVEDPKQSLLKHKIKPVFLASDVRASASVLSRGVKRFTPTSLIDKRKYLPTTLTQKLSTLNLCKFNPIISTSYENPKFVMASAPYSTLPSIAKYFNTVGSTNKELASVNKKSLLKNLLRDIRNRNTLGDYNYLKDYPYFVWGVELKSNYLWVSDLLNHTASIILPVNLFDSVDDLTMPRFAFYYSLGLDAKGIERCECDWENITNLYYDMQKKKPITKTLINYLYTVLGVQVTRNPTECNYLYSRTIDVFTTLNKLNLN